MPQAAAAAEIVLVLAAHYVIPFQVAPAVLTAPAAVASAVLTAPSVVALLTAPAPAPAADASDGAGSELVRND